MDENAHSSSTNARAAHNIGRLGSILRVLIYAVSLFLGVVFFKDY
jgi:hypothetical protein